MLEEVAREHYIQAFILKLPPFGTILLQHLDSGESLSFSIGVQVHGKLAAARHCVDEFTPPASRIQNCCLGGNPPREKLAKNHPHAFSIVASPCEAGLVELLQIRRRMGFRGHDNLTDVNSNSQVPSGIANHPPEAEIASSFRLFPSVCSPPINVKSDALLCESYVTRNRAVWAGGYPDLSVVISDSLEILPLQHYADKRWQQRSLAVLDPGQTLVDVGNDALEKQLAILRQYTNLPIYDWRPFLAEHPAFLLYSSNGGLDRDWWPRRLKKEGFKMQNVSVRPKETHDYFHRVILVMR
jgi:hypothetical protein